MMTGELRVYRPLRHYGGRLRQTAWSRDLQAELERIQDAIRQGYTDLHWWGSPGKSYKTLECVGSVLHVWLCEPYLGVHVHADPGLLGMRVFAGQSGDGTLLWLLSDTHYDSEMSLLEYLPWTPDTRAAP